MEEEAERARAWMEERAEAPASPDDSERRLRHIHQDIERSAEESSDSSETTAYRLDLDLHEAEPNMSTATFGGI